MAKALDFLSILDPSKAEDAQPKELISMITEVAEARLTEFQAGMDQSWTTENLAPGVTKDCRNSVIDVLVQDDLQPVVDAIDSVADSAFALDTDATGHAEANFIKTLALTGFKALMAGVTGSH